MKPLSILSISLLVAVVATAIITALEHMLGVVTVFVTAVASLPILFIWSVLATKDKRS